MTHKWQKIILSILIGLIVVGLAVAAFFVFRGRIWPTSVKDGQSNLSGKLFGPLSSDRAKNLDPDQIIYWTNKYRADEGLSALTRNDKLVAAATTKTSDMFAKQYFEHVSPSGVSPSDLVTAAGYKYKTTGENLALGDFKDEKDLVDAWMASPGHRANILNKDYTEIGVASKLGNYEDRKPTWISTQEFGKPMPNCQVPDPNLMTGAQNKKAQYESLVAQANSLNDQANQKIQQGNDVYASTNDAAQAQPYWDEGNSLRSQAQTLTSQVDTLSAQIKQETDEYNAQVNTYNSCIK